MVKHPGSQLASINEGAMLEAIRKLLDLTIEEFVYEMAWPNTKYYDYIKNGRRRDDGSRQHAHPTIAKVFNGINFALTQHDHWRAKSHEITAIVMSYLLPNA